MPSLPRTCWRKKGVFFTSSLGVWQPIWQGKAIEKGWIWRSNIWSSQKASCPARTLSYIPGDYREEGTGFFTATITQGYLAPYTTLPWIRYFPKKFCLEVMSHSTLLASHGNQTTCWAGSRGLLPPSSGSGCSHQIQLANLVAWVRGEGSLSRTLEIFW